MTREEVCRKIGEIGILPAIRVHSTEDAFFAAETVISGGIPLVEVTMTVPGALNIVAELRRRHPDAVVGAGTVLNVAVARQCLDAGAMFITSPGLDAGIVEATRNAGIASIPGALTPTEVMAAHKAGADIIKIYPCAPMGGPPYIKALRAPFPQVPLIASGGVNQQTATHFIEAGAYALGIREELIPNAAITSRKADWIHELTHRFLGMVHRGRGAKA
jgi:2-dehydro-3-deoxyphosphogluconate aldolase/(4S)-4-hydroxy-2-oxoglutarate aldolase